MANLDISLDDRIKMNQASRPGSRTSGQGPNRRIPNRSAGRSAPYFSSAARTPESQWNPNIYAAATMAALPIQAGAGFASIETGTKLLISNLDYGVSDEDLRELFSALGDLKRCSVNYDRSGRSEGTAEVVFSRRRDAESAIKSYNNVQLDGKPMKIEIIGSNIALPPLIPPVSYGGYQNNAGSSIRDGRGPGRGGSRGRLQGGVRGMRKGQGGDRGRDEKISAQDLDADLDKYHAEAKEETTY